MIGRSWTRNALFIVFGVLILILGIIADRTKYNELHEILIAFGVAIASVSMSELLFLLGGGNPIEEKIALLSSQIQRLSKAVNIIERAHVVGLKDIKDCAANFGGKDDWLNLMKATNHSMDLMGRTLYEWIRAPEFDEILLEKISKGGIKFRWLMMSLDNNHLSQLEEDGQVIGESISKKIDLVYKVLWRIKVQLPDSQKDLLEARIFSHVPLYCSTVRTDDNYIITPYLQSVASRNSPILIVEGKSSPWAKAYAREFEVIWLQSKNLFTTPKNTGNEEMI